MTVRRLTRRRVLGALIAPVLGLVLMIPGPSRADTVYAKIIAYEVAEHIKFKGMAGLDCDDFKKRFSGATLIGDGVTGGPPFDAPPLNVPGSRKKFIDANATSVIKGSTCKGPITGTFHVLEDFDPPASESLSTLQIVAQGRLRGTLDLSTIGTTATAPVSGTWRVHASNLKGKFEGAFAAPFFVPEIPAIPPLGFPGFPGGFVYADVDPTPNSCRTSTAPEGGAEVPVLLPIGPGGSLVLVNVCPVHPEEFLLGFPLTKVVLFLSIH